jgi:RNA polymerase sigma-70 factor (ECF subfamily)
MQNKEQDKALIARIAKLDRLAMREFYDTYSDAVYRFAKIWLADPFDASDIMHETMMEVWKSAGKFGGRSSVKTWLFSIAKNKSIDRNRKAGRTILKDPDPNVADEAPTPVAALEAFQDAEKVRACVEGLSPTHKVAVHLAFYEDLTYREIADMEGCPVGTIKTRIMHAKKLLMRCLSNEL